MRLRKRAATGWGALATACGVDIQTAYAEIARRVPSSGPAMDWADLFTSDERREAQRVIARAIGVGLVRVTMAKGTPRERQEVAAIDELFDAIGHLAGIFAPDRLEAQVDVDDTIIVS